MDGYRGPRFGDGAWGGGVVVFSHNFFGMLLHARATARSAGASRAIHTRDLRSHAIVYRAAEPPERRREAPARRRRRGEVRMRCRCGTAARRVHQTNAGHTLTRLGCWAIPLLNGPSRKKKHANAHRRKGIALGCCAISWSNGPGRRFPATWHAPPKNHDSVHHRLFWVAGRLFWPKIGPLFCGRSAIFGHFSAAENSRPVIENSRPVIRRTPIFPENSRPEKIAVQKK